VPHPLILVCTHGRHDACCSVRGNQVSRLACNAYPGLAWECSHIGGDRFAANVVCFPHGVYYGRVGPAELVDVVEAYGKGWLALEHYRGRSAFPFDVQAAEYFLRRDHHLLGIGEVKLEGFERTGNSVEATFQVPQGQANVHVKVLPGTEKYRLTCGAEHVSAIPSYELVSCSIA
ncbi:MAG: hypothetical protein QOH90_2009, partial [Actinomycetota bacterium]|nr:hypothetical protein [Actinomycetota bacterium]